MNNNFKPIVEALREELLYLSEGSWTEKDIAKTLERIADRIEKACEPIAKSQLPASTDARVWATEWLETISKNPSIPTDKETMVTWFSNAIMAGYDEAKREFKNSWKYEKEKDVNYLSKQFLKFYNEVYKSHVQPLVEALEQIAGQIKDGSSYRLSDIATKALARFKEVSND